MEKLTPRPELLVGRSDQVAQDAEKRVRELLVRHPSLVAPGIIDLIAQAEAESARQEYIRRRNKGEANDYCSRQPGLILYLTPQGCDKAIEEFKQVGYAIVPTTQIMKINSNLVALQLPKAIYGTGLETAEFHLEAEADYRQTNKAEKPFELETGYIVRIEGSADELWQNKDYQWDGTPKATS